MSDPVRPFSRGDSIGRLRDHNTLNALLAGARLALGLDGFRTGGDVSLPRLTPGNTVLITAHKNLDLGSVVGFGALNGSHPADDDEPGETSKTPALVGAPPAEGEPFAILAADAGEDEAVPAVISGVALVRLSTPGGSVYGFADVIPDDTEKLLAATFGPARVLWSESDPEDEDERWALVLLGASSDRTGIARVIAPASGGLYPAHLIEEVEDGVWEARGEIRLKPLDGTLRNLRHYLARRAGWESDGLPVYHAVHDCCPDDATACGCCEDWDVLPAETDFCATIPSLVPRGYFGPTVAAAVSGTAVKIAPCGYYMLGETEMSFPGFGTYTVRVRGHIFCIGGLWQPLFDVDVTDDDEYLSRSYVYYNSPDDLATEEIGAECDPLCLELRWTDITQGGSSGYPSAAPYLADITVTLGDCALPCDESSGSLGGGGCGDCEALASDYDLTFPGVPSDGGGCTQCDDMISTGTADGTYIGDCAWVFGTLNANCDSPAAETFTIYMKWRTAAPAGITDQGAGWYVYGTGNTSGTTYFCYFCSDADFQCLGTSEFDFVESDYCSNWPLTAEVVATP